MSTDKAVRAAAILRNSRKVEKFWSQIARTENGCWLWIGTRSSYGYGSVSMVFNGKFVRGAHRVAYYLTYGAPPFDKPCVCHKCDIPSCCNPKHLFPGTKADNNTDRHTKGRSSSVYHLSNIGKKQPEQQKNKRAAACHETNARRTPEQIAAVSAAIKAGIARKKLL